MDLRRLSMNAAAFDRLQRANIRRGMTGRNKLWSSEEKALIPKIYPDYRALEAALPDRSTKAIQAQAIRLGITVPRHTWTAAEHSIVRSLYPRASRDAIMARLPGLAWSQIADHAYRSGFKRARRPYRNTGWPLLDEIRSKCRDLAYTMADLDQIAGTRRYFRGRHWRSSRLRASPAVLKAVVALGGVLKADWQD